MAKTNEPTSKEILQSADDDLHTWLDEQIQRCETTIQDVTSAPSWTLYCARRKERLIKMREAITNVQ